MLLQKTASWQKRGAEWLGGDHKHTSEKGVIQENLRLMEMAIHTQNQALTKLINTVDLGTVCLDFYLFLLRFFLCVWQSQLLPSQ